MIRLIENNCPELEKICSRDVFGTRIAAYFRTYGAKFDFLKVWIQLDENDAPTAAISLMESDMTLTACENADFEELEFFIKATPFSSLQCERGAVKKLSLDETLWGYVVEYKNPQPVDSEIVSFLVDFKAMYSLISSAGLLGVGDYLPWLSDITYRTNHGTAQPAAICENGSLSACAAALFITDNAALLGAVATEPSRRGNGFGGALVKTLGNKMLGEGRRTELLCKNDSIVEFYKSIGFTVSREWAIFNRTL